MNIKVTKRSGTVVELELEKWQAQVAKMGVKDIHAENPRFPGQRESSLG